MFSFISFFISVYALYTFCFSVQLYLQLEHLLNCSTANNAVSCVGWVGLHSLYKLDVSGRGDGCGPCGSFKHVPACVCDATSVLNPAC